ncbi:MAG: flagellar motor switch protein FliN [Treponemataceae bacterium]
MAETTISQDEIDALLSGVQADDAGGKISMDLKVLETFSKGTKETLKNSLKTMTGVDFEVGAPTVETINKEAMLEKLPEMIVASTADFIEGFTGDHFFVINQDFGKKLAGLITKDDIAELDEMALSVISEIISQHTGSEITALSEKKKAPGLACAPVESIQVAKSMARWPQQDFVLLSFPVSTEGQSFTLWEVVSSQVASSMINALSDSSSQSQQNFTATSAQSAGQMGSSGVPNVHSLQYQSLQNGVGIQEQGNIGLIMDVFMEMTVELGRTKKQIKEILGLGEGTIIELDKLAGEPVDILVNHKAIAKGEVVVIDENFGVRVTEILSPIERVSE